MKKLLITLLSILFFNTSIFAGDGTSSGGGGNVFLSSELSSNEAEVWLPIDVLSYLNRLPNEGDNLGDLSPGPFTYSAKSLQHLSPEDDALLKEIEAHLKLWRDTLASGRSIESVASSILVERMLKTLNTMPFIATPWNFKTRKEFSIPDDISKNIVVRTAVLYTPYCGYMLSLPIWKKLSVSTKKVILTHELLRRNQMMYGSFVFGQEALQTIVSQLMYSAPRTDLSILDLMPAMFRRELTETARQRLMYSSEYQVVGDLFSLLHEGVSIELNSCVENVNKKPQEIESLLYQNLKQNGYLDSSTKSP